jgi:hypothetical protein
LRAGEFASGLPTQPLTDKRSHIEWTR